MRILVVGQVILEIYNIQHKFAYAELGIIDRGIVKISKIFSGNAIHCITREDPLRVVMMAIDINPQF